MSVYLVLSYDVFDQKRFAQYRTAAALVVPQFNGKILSSQQNPGITTGASTPSHMSLVKFDTIEDLRSLRNSKRSRSLLALRVESAETSVHVLYGDDEKLS
ncbi:hypothetical protein DI396_03785 [Litorivita pollutaquae]|uniref:DUF1330 domain-containing protein n=1 Tax=Litorivita pollutaquae TaxID=2200892 RepID=A0A2V4NFI7_9RHOB|nr:DUF1330 domain-containing protein [Litorivita pollutaquae]OUS20406.1 hypothetical protein A9Q95_08530 [Rhodobacterales bacterium 59_46_T64]PYC49173.1 hypothetical protein DI396_03785 [Litorivita pollutaquae]